jgi:hypothetical protein
MEDDYSTEMMLIECRRASQRSCVTLLVKWPMDGFGIDSTSLVVACVV